MHAELRRRTRVGALELGGRSFEGYIVRARGCNTGSPAKADNNHQPARELANRNRSQAGDTRAPPIRPLRPLCARHFLPNSSPLPRSERLRPAPDGSLGNFTRLLATTLLT